MSQQQASAEEMLEIARQSNYRPGAHKKLGNAIEGNTSKKTQRETGREYHTNILRTIGKL
jgi:hypothetical protein